MIAGIGFVAAPALFATLARADAGRAAARLFALDASIGLGLGVVLLMLTMQRARLVVEGGGGSRLSAELLLVMAALFAIVAGHFALQPMIDAARQSASGPSFATLHGVASLFFGVKFLAVAVLAWRLGPRPQAEAAATTAVATLS